MYLFISTHDPFKVFWAHLVTFGPFESTRTHYTSIHVLLKIKVITSHIEYCFISTSFLFCFLFLFFQKEQQRMTNCIMSGYVLPSKENDFQCISHP